MSLFDRPSEGVSQENYVFFDPQSEGIFQENCMSPANGTWEKKRKL